MMGLFGNDKTRKTYVTTDVDVLGDQRVAVGGSVGSLVSPGAAVGGAGAVNAAPYSTVTQEISMAGLGANEVETLLAGVMAPVTSLATSIEAGSRETAKSLADVVAATKAPDQTALSSLLPLALLAVILIMVD